jgi:hypothetical protein
MYSTVLDIQHELALIYVKRKFEKLAHAHAMLPRMITIWPGK